MTTRAAASADRVLAELDAVPVDSLRVLASGLELAGSPLDLLGAAVDYRADFLSFGGSAELGALAMRVFLKQAARDAALADRLDVARAPLWVAVREALDELRGEDADEIVGEDAA